MAHAGQEAALGLVGLFGPFFGLLQLGGALTHDVFQVLLMATQLLPPLFQRGDHAVEGLRHGRDVLRPAHLGPHGHIAMFCLSHHARQVFQRLRQAQRQPANHHQKAAAQVKEMRLAKNTWAVMRCKVALLYTTRTCPRTIPWGLHVKGEASDRVRLAQ